MASQRAGVVGLSTGTQKGDVYSFAVILHEILYRAGLFRCVEDDESIPAKSKSFVLPDFAIYCLSNAIHGQNINLPVCLCVCPSHFLSTRLQARPLGGFLQLIA